MTKSTILFVSYALRGHANPCLAMADELARRGHHVQFAMPEEGADWVRHPEVEFVSWEPSELRGLRVTEIQRRVRAEASQQPCWHRGQCLVTQSMVDTYGPVFNTLSALVKKLKPGILLTPQTTVPAMDVAVQAGIPLVIEAFYLPRSARKKTAGRVFGGHPRLSLPLRLERFVCQQRLWNAWRRHDHVRRRCSECVSYGEMFRRHCVISTTHECVEDRSAVRSNVRLAGPLIGEPAPLPDTLAEWLDASVQQGVIFVAFGTLVTLRQRQIHALLAGLRQSRCRVLWALPTGQQSMLGHVPDSVRIESFVDQVAVLAHPAVRGFVSHAGGNSFMESMLHGSPMLACPFMLDQPFFANRAVELEVGICLDGHTMTAQAVRDNLARLTGDRTYASNARRLSQILRHAPGVSGAADIVEGVLEGRESPHAYAA